MTVQLAQVSSTPCGKFGQARYRRLAQGLLLWTTRDQNRILVTLTWWTWQRCRTLRAFQDLQSGQDVRVVSHILCWRCCRSNDSALSADDNPTSAMVPAPTVAR
eukprot:1160396-Amphidinium_carterae.1